MNHSIIAINKTFLMFLFAILSFWIGAGCQTKTLENSQVHPSGAEMDARSGTKKTGSSYRLSLGSGGGFAGHYTGFNLYEDGRIERWQRFASGSDTVLWTYQDNDSTVAFFKQRLIRLGILNKKIQESGNMNTQIRLELTDTTYLWYWSQTADTSLVQWTRDVEKFCRQIENTHIKK
jgi:hypothetical protein